MEVRGTRINLKEFWIFLLFACLSLSQNVGPLWRDQTGSICIYPFHFFVLRLNAYVVMVIRLRVLKRCLCHYLLGIAFYIVSLLIHFGGQTSFHLVEKTTRECSQWCDTANNEILHYLGVLDSDFDFVLLRLFA